MAGYYANPSDNHSVMTITGFDFTRSIHPKTRGFTAVKDFLHQAIPKMRTAPAVGSCMANGNLVLYNGSDADTASASQASVIPTSAPSGLPASLCVTAAGDYGFATALPPSSITSAAPSSKPTCTFTGDPLTGVSVQTGPRLRGMRTTGVAFTTSQGASLVCASIKMDLVVERPARRLH